MKNEEAIEILHELHDQCCQADSIFCTDVTGARCDAVDMAIEALEKQIPKKTKHVITNMGINGNFRRECPSCGWLMFERVTTKDESKPVVCRILNFCQSCGQRIDWGGIMTNKKAVEKLREEFCKLKAFCELYPDACRKEECEIYMSIKALEGKDADFPSNGTISRQMAVKEAKELYDMGGCYCDRASMIGMLNSLPPAQPEQPSEIQDILDYLDTVLHPIISPEHWNVYSELHDMISGLPSAQPKSYKEKLKEIADALSEKFAYMNTCLNERDIILGYLGVKRPSEIHCNTDCTNIKCESHYCYKKTPSAQSEIIHCKDCIWHNKDINQCDRQVCAVMYADDFCSYGERRGEQE